jgi:hypothetical protein
MMQRRRVFVLLASAAIGGANALQASPTGSQGHCSQAHGGLGHRSADADADNQARHDTKDPPHSVHDRGWVINGIAAHVRQSRLPVFQGRCRIPCCWSPKPRRERTGDAGRGQRGHHCHSLHTVLAVQCHGLNQNTMCICRASRRCADYSYDCCCNIPITLKTPKPRRRNGANLCKRLVASVEFRFASQRAVSRSFIGLKCMESISRGGSATGSSSVSQRSARSPTIRRRDSRLNRRSGKTIRKRRRR